MKFLLVVLLSLISLLHAKYAVKNGQQMETIRSKCLEEHPLPADEVIKMMHFDMTDSENLRKFTLCMFKRMELFSDASGFSRDNLIKQMTFDTSESFARTLADKCLDGNKQRSSNVDYSYRVFKCITTNFNAELERKKTAICRQEELSGK